MFLRYTTRKKSGKEHRYYSRVENRPVARGRVVQRHALYLGEIKDSQQEAWRKTIEIFEEGQPRPRTGALFPEDRIGPVDDADIVRIRLRQLSLHRPRQGGAGWLACERWEQLGWDRFGAEHLQPSRKGTRWDWVLQILVTYRLLDPGREWRWYRHWFEHSARADLLGADQELAQIHKLYQCPERLLAHTTPLFTHLMPRWEDLFKARFEVLLYDLTSPCFESHPPFPEGDKRRHGDSRDKRPDCVQGIKRRSGKLTFALRKDKRRRVRKREGRSLLRSNILSGRSAEELWKFYIQLTEVEAAFKTLKDALALRPIHHQLADRIDAHIFISFGASCLHVALRRRLRDWAPGLTPRSVLEKFATIPMLDVHLPTTDERTVVLTRYPHPETDVDVLLHRLKLELPAQPPPKIMAAQPAGGGRSVVKTWPTVPLICRPFRSLPPSNPPSWASSWAAARTALLLRGPMLPRVAAHVLDGCRWSAMPPRVP